MRWKIIPALLMAATIQDVVCTHAATVKTEPFDTWALLA